MLDELDIGLEGLLGLNTFDELILVKLGGLILLSEINIKHIYNLKFK